LDPHNGAVLAQDLHWGAQELHPDKPPGISTTVSPGPVVVSFMNGCGST